MANEWQQVEDMPAFDYNQARDAEGGPNRDATFLKFNRAIEFFQAFVNDQMLEEIVQNSQAYFARRFPGMRGQININLQNLKLFLGVKIIMGLQYMPFQRMY